ncbi:hypothetical protein C5745_14025 [Sphingobacterium haloxyli]|uniref:Uncharacterized protein n=2 Tax=Sphingobacterium haloxyli TaxID=2100533 RepID=A0A2S9J1R3_9SPHI|nr:hypothetical protein C5745_14025 [Sphingobacterium haloxyli]
MNVNILGMLLLGAAITFGACSKDKEAIEPEEIIEEPIDDDDNTDESAIAVQFADADLADFIRLELEELEVKVGEEITRGDLLNLKELSIRGVLTEVASLQGLEYATELEHLDFGGTKVSDLTPIKDLEKITYLRFNETPVADLSPIAAYTNLTYFNANQASPGLTDLSALSGNEDMGTLILRGNLLGDEGLATISGFKKLHRLNARSTGAGDATVVMIGQMMAEGALLKTTEGYVDKDSELDLRGNEIEDWSPIESFIEDDTAVPVQGM